MHKSLYKKLEERKRSIKNLINIMRENKVQLFRSSKDADKFYDWAVQE